MALTEQQIELTGKQKQQIETGRALVRDFTTDEEQIARVNRWFDHLVAHLDSILEGKIMKIQSPHPDDAKVWNQICARWPKGTE